MMFVIICNNCLKFQNDPEAEQHNKLVESTLINRLIGEIMAYCLCLCKVVVPAMG